MRIFAAFVVWQGSTTIFYVSHATASVRAMCDRVLVLESGRLNFDGSVEDGISYLHYEDAGDPKDALADEEIGADI